MPRKPIDWSKCMFYRLVCRDISVRECYVGQTCNEVKRRNKHNSCCNNEKSPSHNYFVYQFIREHGGWQNWQLLVHEKLPMNNEVEAAIRERFWLEHYKAKLNKCVPSRTKAEYNVDNRDKIKEDHAKYDATHREEKGEYNSNYYIEHRNHIKEQSAAWKLANAAYSKTKHECACGGRYTTAGHCDHIKTKMHIAFEAAN
jgi:GIY-YIG catalytic domain